MAQPSLQRQFARVVCACLPRRHVCTIFQYRQRFDTCVVSDLFEISDGKIWLLCDNCEFCRCLMWGNRKKNIFLSAYSLNSVLTKSKSVAVNRESVSRGASLSRLTATLLDLVSGYNSSSRHKVNRRQNISQMYITVNIHQGAYSSLLMHFTQQ